MRKIYVLVLILALVGMPQLVQSASVTNTAATTQDWPLDAQSTTGPFPPPDLMDSYDPSDLDYEVVIPGVPAYLWYRGCGPTAAGMVLGYWDGRGFDDLVPGNAATQTPSVNAMISSSGNYNDYCLPLDSPPTLLPDLSELPFGDEHSDNCVADLMETSQSYHGNYYGWSWFSDVDDGLYQYVQLIDPLYDVTVENVYWSSFTWTRFRSEIDAGRPVVFLVDTDGNGETDHFVTAIGYGEEYGTPMYACLNTWDSNVHWYEFTGMASAQPWGIYGATTFNIVSELAEVDIKANGSDGSITVSSLTNVSVTIALDATPSPGAYADWWVLAKTTAGKWFYYNHAARDWFPGKYVSHQGPLFDLATFEVLNRILPGPTSYTFHFGVDTVVNGSIDMGSMIYDSVDVNVRDTSSVVGRWDIFYDWGCDGSPGNTWIEFFTNGTFGSGEGYTGTWTQNGDQVNFYITGGTDYTGTIMGDFMTGTMVSYSGMTGCWDASRLSLSDASPEGSTDSGLSFDGTEVGD